MSLDGSSVKKPCTYCEECGKKLYFDKGFNVLNNKRMCKACYRKNKNKKI